MKAAEIVRKENVDFLLVVGGSEDEKIDLAIQKTREFFESLMASEQIKYLQLLNS
ncbi:hypothetical protein [Fonticella tunisiensis]|uniref:hypothetical protein n=1 Tax=Fonticella tunisiensis TaxID=1096341 RepID=UPI001A9B3105|nr:hypothetical protein [Fonticella tunisiensis]